MGWSWAGLISPIANTVQKISSNKAEVTKRNIDRIINAEDKAAEWELIQAENSKHSWRDEWFTILLSIPLVGAFIPPLVPHIQAGFAVLLGMPEQYQFWLTVAILSSFGIRAIKK